MKVPSFILDVPLLYKAYKFADDAHTNRTEDGEPQLRKFSGVPYIVHPIAVAKILLVNGVTDPNMLAGALLHDVVEDTLVEIDEIRLLFGEDISYLVDGMTKSSLGSPESRARRKAMDRDAYARYCERVQTIKCADILHNALDFTRNYKKAGKHCLTWLSEAEDLLSALMLGEPKIRNRAITVVEDSLATLTPKFL